MGPPYPTNQQAMTNQERAAYLRRSLRRKRQEQIRSDPEFMRNRRDNSPSKEPDSSFYKGAANAQEPPKATGPMGPVPPSAEELDARQFIGAPDEGARNSQRAAFAGKQPTSRFERWAQKGLKGAAGKAKKVPLVGSPLHRALKRMARDPKRAAGVLAGGLGAAGLTAAQFAPTIVEGAYDDSRNLYSRITRGVGADELSMDEQLANQREAEDAAWEMQRQQEEIERLARVNEQRLMQMHPVLANQILAGRRLPRGAMVIGGKPRTDLLREFATQMAEMSTSEPQGAPEQAVFP
jgi:hypothetical protein